MNFDFGTDFSREAFRSFGYGEYGTAAFNLALSVGEAYFNTVALGGATFLAGMGLSAAAPFLTTILGRTTSEVAVNTTIAGINTAAYWATNDNPTLEGAALNFAESYGLARIGAIIANAPGLTLSGKSIFGASIGGGIDFSIQTAQIQTGYRDDYDYWQLGGSTFSTGLSVLPYQSFGITGQIGTDIWTHAFPQINTAFSTTTFFGSMAWYENQRKKNGGRGRLNDNDI